MSLNTAKNKCTGCTACASICPIGCIEMLEDIEGFDYPLVNKDKCINCNLCSKICPINAEIEVSKKTMAFAVQNKDELIKEKSSAGGVVGAIYSYVFSLNGVVYGACFDSNNMVKHMHLNSIEECLERKVFSSKYVTSDLNAVFKDVEINLKKNKLICFVGLPCQIVGLKAFLQITYDNLLTIDLTCYGVPSRKLYRKYIDFLETKYSSKVVDVRFRDKICGYSVPTMCVEFSDGRVRSQNSYIKSYLRAFFSNISMRQSCYNCPFKGLERQSDITIGDLKNIGDFYPELDDDKGTTVLYIHTDKAKKILNEIKENIVYAQLPVDIVLNTSGKKMIESPKENIKRSNFFNDIDNLEYKELINKYCSANISEYIANLIKGGIIFWGLNRTSIMRMIKRR